MPPCDNKTVQPRGETGLHGPAALIGLLRAGLEERMKNILREEMEQYNLCHSLFERGSRIVAGVSGGADSVCLLELLCELREKWELALYVLHVHHGIRGTEADRDAHFVEELAAERGLPFRLVQVNVPEEAARRGMSEEETGRILRYHALEVYRQQVSADRIAVAHHQGDQAETVLFRLFRGSGPRGLSGIPPRRGAVIRPLLFADRARIEKYLQERGMGWCEDRTNRETVYTRNRIRHQILTLAEETINPEAGRHIAQAAEKLAEWASFIGRMGTQAYGRAVIRERDGLRLSTEGMQKEDPVLQAEILRRVFEELVPGAKDIGRIHYDQVRRLLSGEAGRRLDLPGGVRAERHYDSILFRLSRPDGNLPLCVACGVPSQHIVEQGGVLWRFTFERRERPDLPEEIPQKDYTKLFDYDMIKSGLVIRNPGEGDYFVMDAAGRKKRLSRYYIDRKIPKSMRPGQLVVADGSHVLWAVPDRISEAYKITNNTERILVITKERIP